MSSYSHLFTSRTRKIRKYEVKRCFILTPHSVRASEDFQRKIATKEMRIPIDETHVKPQCFLPKKDNLRINQLKKTLVNIDGFGVGFHVFRIGSKRKVLGMSGLVGPFFLLPNLGCLGTLRLSACLRIAGGCGE